MRTPVKVLVWTLVFAGCAGLGAYVAAHTDPFPPGVTDPGERPSSSVTTSSSATPSPTPEAGRWQLRARVLTDHVLHVGGVCRSDWDVQALLRERLDGRLSGDGLATVRPGAGCDFPTADVQARTVLLHVRGTRTQRTTTLRFTLAEPPRPAGSKDLGAFVELVEVVGVPVRLDPPFVVERGDGNDGTYRAAWRSRISCVAGC